MRRNAGFTLIELLIVITIIAIMSAVGFTSYVTFVKNSRDAKRQSDLKFIQSALEQYFADQKYYPQAGSGSCPSTGDGLFRNKCSLTNLNGTKIYINQIPSDPNNTVNNYRFEPRVQSCDSSPICDNATSNKCACYCLFVKMENQQGDKTEGRCSLPPQNYNFSLTRP